jgi:hypothetical protein
LFSSFRLPHSLVGEHGHAPCKASFTWTCTMVRHKALTTQEPTMLYFCARTVWNDSYPLLI